MRLRILALALVFCGAIGMSAMPGAAMAIGGGELIAVTCPDGSKRTGTQPTYADCNLPTDAEMPTKDVPTVAQSIINVLVSSVGIVAVLVIVIGGVLYVTSAGDTTKTKRAQNAILYGVIGLIISVLAYAIVNFVLKSIF